MKKEQKQKPDKKFIFKQTMFIFIHFVIFRITNKTVYTNLKYKWRLLRPSSTVVVRLPRKEKVEGSIPSWAFYFTNYLSYLSF